MNIIHRTVHTPERMLEIIESMPTPIIVVTSPNENSIHDYIVEARNYQGICQYTFKAYDKPSPYHCTWKEYFTIKQNLYSLE